MSSTILLGSGNEFDYLAPELSNITIEDIAYGLAYSCRFAGQCRQGLDGKRIYYSVAEHCVRMSHIVPPAHSYSALMHEVGESVCGDLAGPLKRLCRDFSKIEKLCAAAIKNKFQAFDQDADLIKHFDHVMLATERRDLMPWNGIGWELPVEVAPHSKIIEPWPAEQAALAFLARYRQLRGLPETER